MNRNNTVSLLTSWFGIKYKLIAQGVIIGLSAGVVVVMYRFILEHVLSASLALYRWQAGHLWFIPIWLVLLTAGGWLTGAIVKQQPIIAGSGIPQVKGVLHGLFDMVWWKTILGKFIGGTLSIGAGLSLGREGPSIQIGAAVGQGYSRLFKKVKIEEHFLLTCGASAGLSAAFNAPIAGVIFALEEIHNNFSPLVMISALAASLAADFVTSEFFGLNPIFQFSHITPIPLGQYAYVIILGVVVGVLGIVFNKLLFAVQNLYDRQKWLPASARPVIPFLMAGVLGLLLPVVLGGGNELVNSLFSGNFTLGLLVLLLASKLLFTMISYGSSAPGGIFLPMLVVGALIGVIYYETVHYLFGYSSAYLGNFIILAMAGYFTAVVKAPITGIILITEMTGSFSNLLSTGVVCLMAYVVVELFKSKPIYEELLERILHRSGADYKPEQRSKLLLEIPVHAGSALAGKRIKEMQWPAHCLIVGIKRGESEMIPTGDTELRAGDYLVILTSEDAAPHVRHRLTDNAITCNVP